MVSLGVWRFFALKAVVLLGITGWDLGAQASEAMTGYVSGGAAYALHTQAAESGARINYKLEFARVVKNISAELRFGTGLNYTDVGGTLKGYYHFNFQDPTVSATGISLGAGAGALYSNGGSVLAGVTGARPFTDVVVQPFVRFLWDSKFNVGGLLELGMDLVPYRKYSGSSAPSSDTRTRLRFYIGVGLAIGA